ncbi:MAG: glycosyl hydrolase family 28-related protein, partial [Candidatus Hinthialibacter sp.]
MMKKMYGLTVFPLAALSLLTASFAMAGDNPVSWNVKDYGALGDGVVDDGPAIGRALDAAAKAGGGEVFLPAGKYRIADSLSVPSGVTLRGVWQAPHHADQAWGTALLAVGHRGDEKGPALIQLAPSSAVKGLTIYYPDQRLDDVQPYPWAIQGRGMHGSVIDVTLVNAYQGIDFGTHRNELHYIRNVYGCCLRRGIYIDGCTDIGRIENVHFNPHYWARAQVDDAERVKDFRGLIDYLNTNAEVFIFGRTDWEYVHNTFAFGFDKCYKFIETERGACNGNFLGLGADGGHYAVWVEATQPAGLLITNGEFVTFAKDDPIEIVTTPSFKGLVQFSNCSFWGPTDRCAQIEGQGFVSFQQC